MKRAAGFTLVELLLALVIAGILASIAVPGYTAYARRARRVEAQVALVDAMQQQERHYTAHNRYLTYTGGRAAPPPAPFRWHSGATPATSAYEIRALPCTGEGVDTCVLLQAIPGTDNVNPRYRDPECGTLSLDSKGRQGSSGTDQVCWP